MLTEGALGRFAQERNKYSNLQPKRIEEAVTQQEVSSGAERLLESVEFWNGIATDVDTVITSGFSNYPPTHSQFFEHFDPKVNPAAEPRHGRSSGKYFMLGQAMRYAQGPKANLNPIISFEYTPPPGNPDLQRAVSMARRKMFALRDFDPKIPQRVKRYETLLKDPCFWEDFSAFTNNPNGPEELFGAIAEFSAAIYPQFRGNSLSLQKPLFEYWFDLVDYFLDAASTQGVALPKDSRISPEFKIAIEKIFTHNTTTYAPEDIKIQLLTRFPPRPDTPAHSDPTPQPQPIIETIETPAETPTEPATEPESVEPDTQAPTIEVPHEEPQPQVEQILPEIPQWLTQIIPNITHKQVIVLQQLDREALVLLAKQQKLIRGAPDFLKQFGMFIQKANANDKTALDAALVIDETQAVKGIGLTAEYLKRHKRFANAYELGKVIFEISQEKLIAPVKDK